VASLFQTQCMYVVLQDALGIELVCERTLSSALAVVCLLDAKVLYQLCCFGMADVDQVLSLCLLYNCHVMQRMVLLSQFCLFVCQMRVL